MAPQIGWIGLGNMGRGMVKNLVEKGNLDKPLIIYNRTASRSEKLAAELAQGKTKVERHVADVVKAADVIFYCLGDDNAVEENVDAMIEAGAGGKLFVDCSTIHPDTTDSLAKKFTSAGAEFVACPVFGAPAMADAGQLVCVLAGPKAAVDKVKPYCKGVMGREIIDYSDKEQGTATRLKIIGNTFILNMIETLAEGHTLAEKSGLGTSELHQFVQTMFPGPYTAYSSRMLDGDYHKREEPLFAVDLAIKDARHARDLGKAAGVRMGHSELASEHLEHVKRKMGPSGDVSSIYGAVREDNGLEFKN